jgi:16S rRNA (guanine(966)-N(2))-methyltransferase RsmD
MRVIAGSLKGRRLQSPTWAGLRPTSDSLRETLFNVLAQRIEGARVLDGYAGTGAVGIEAYSRGAQMVAFVDRDPRAQRLIAANVDRCGIPRGCVIIRSGFDGGGAGRALPSGSFDIVVLDPPYDDQPEQVILAVAPLVAPAGVLVLEHSKRRQAPDAIATLTRTRQIVAGDSALSFYEHPPR